MNPMKEQVSILIEESWKKIPKERICTSYCGVPFEEFEKNELIKMLQLEHSRELAKEMLRKDAAEFASLAGRH